MLNQTFEIIEWQARTRDLEVANERLREERELARALAANLEAELANKEEQIKQLDQMVDALHAQVDRLRLHLQQGVEL